MKKLIKRLITNLILWCIKDKFDKIDKELNEFSKYEQDRMKLRNLFNHMDVGVDVAPSPSTKGVYYSPSWAVISIQGKSHDFVKFIVLEDKDLLSIRQFLEHFNKKNIKIDSTPNNTPFLRY